MTYDNKGKGALWENGKIPLGPQDPVYTGNFTDMEGEEHFISVWKNTARTHNRQPAFRFSVRKKEEALAEQKKTREEAATSNKPPVESFEDFDDDIPF